MLLISLIYNLVPLIACGYLYKLLKSLYPPTHNDGLETTKLNHVYNFDIVKNIAFQLKQYSLKSQYNFSNLLAVEK